MSMTMSTTSFCNYCGVKAAQRCNACGMVVYCSREHQKLDWKKHKLACKEFQSLKLKGKQWEGDVKDGEYGGTFRWSQKLDFIQMPPYLAPAALDNGWSDFFETRLGYLESKIVLDVALIDGLSFPLSFLCLMRLVLEQNSGIKDWMYGRDRILSVVAMGCAERAEEHILNQTNYWQEIAHMMPSFQIHLWLVGPEMSETSHKRFSGKQEGPRMTIRCYRGTLSQFLSEHRLLSHCQEGPGGPKTVFIGYNTGMASGDVALQSSWELDIQLLMDNKALTLFTCANDHTDLKCEKALMNRLKANFVLEPRKNPFSAATTLHPPGQQETGWYTANAMIYAIQGLSGMKSTATKIVSSGVAKLDNAKGFRALKHVASSEGKQDQSAVSMNCSILAVHDVRDETQRMEDLYLPD